MPDFEQPTTSANIPYVVLIIDESGSMLVSRDTTVSAMNDYIQGLKLSLPAETKVTVVKFDSDYSQRVNNQVVRINKLFDAVPLSEARVIVLEDYTPTGGTPLYDAIGKTIIEIDALVAENPGPVYVAVLTDGAENTSREFKSDAVKRLIEERQTKSGWTFAFMGVDIDSYATGSVMGFRAGDTVNLSRGTIVGSSASLSASIGRKYGASETMDEVAYAAWNATDATFTAEDRSKIEKK